MGRALSMFRLKSGQKEEFRRDFETTFVPGSQSMFIGSGDVEFPNSQRENIIAPGIAYPTSKLEFIRERNDGCLEYRATHYTETKTTPIRVFLDDEHTNYSEWTPHPSRIVNKTVSSPFGFQEIHKFTVVADFEKMELQLFYSTKIVSQFMARLRSIGIETESLDFDLEKISRVDKATNISGEWITTKGRVKKVYFSGTGVNKEKIPLGGVVTSYTMEYQYGGREIHLFVGADGRIGSQSSGLTEYDILKIYNELQEKMGYELEDRPQNTTERVRPRGNNPNSTLRDFNI